MSLSEILCKEREKLSLSINKFIDKMIPDHENKLETEKFVNEIIRIQENMTELFYFDLQQVKKHCDDCTYKDMPPSDGAFFDKADTYIKERSKWAWVIVGSITVLSSVIVGIYLFWFTQVANTVFDIKDTIIRHDNQIITNNSRLQRIEAIYFGDNK